MSVVCWDGTTLAADKQATNGSAIGTVSKICRRGDALLAFTGDAAFGWQMIAWWEAGAKPDAFPPSQRDKDDWAGLIVIQKGKPLLKFERTPYPVPFEGKFHTAGCGRDFAMAALHLGKTAREAVEVAIALDAFCGQGIDTLSFEE